MGRLLYHGTAAANVPSIMAEGLRTDRPANWYDESSGYIYLATSVEHAVDWVRDYNMMCDPTLRTPAAAVFVVDAEELEIEDDPFNVNPTFPSFRVAGDVGPELIRLAETVPL